MAAAVALALGGCAQFTFPDLPKELTRLQSSDEAEVAEQPDTEAQAEAPPEEPEPGKPAPLYEWNGDGRDVTRVVIDTNEQKARFYAGEDELGWTTIASGVAKHPTPRGEFAVLEKVRDKRSNLYGKLVSRSGKVIRASAHGRDPVPSGARFVGASMPHFMRLTYDGIGMHAGPIPNPGQPASHGCIRMPPKMASTVFEHMSNGTRVTVVGDGPDYGNYAQRIARQRAEAEARRAAAAAAAQGTALDALDAEIEVMERAGVSASPSAQATRSAAASQPPPRPQAQRKPKPATEPKPKPRAERAPKAESTPPAAQRASDDGQTSEGRDDREGTGSEPVKASESVESAPASTPAAAPQTSAGEASPDASTDASPARAPDPEGVAGPTAPEAVPAVAPSAAPGSAPNAPPNAGQPSPRAQPSEVESPSAEDAGAGTNNETGADTRTPPQPAAESVRAPQSSEPRSTQPQTPAEPTDQDASAPPVRYSPPAPPPTLHSASTISPASPAI